MAFDLNGVENVYSEDEVAKLISEDTTEILREDQWLEEVFGAQSRLQNDEWVAKVSKEANWIFDADKLRKKMFAAAEVAMRH